MKKIDKPPFSITTIVLKSINNLRDSEMKIEVTENIDLFQSYEDNFDLKKQNNTLYQLSRNEGINSNINSDFLKKLYTERMLNKTNEARRFYDYIIVSAPKGKCPNCNQRQANTLDHYLPKSEYPILSVSPLNLIPSCSVCNSGKLCDYPTSEVEEVIHPYYDEIDQVNWLQCSIVSIKPLIFEFSVKNCIFPHEPILEERLKQHFISFELNKLYISHSNEEFENIKYQLEKLFINGGYINLKQHLFDCYESRKLNDNNSWQTAYYKCLYESEDFCNGLFI